MLLRDHPLKSSPGVPNWPPLRTRIGELENTHPERVIGVLKSISPFHIQPADGFFLCINYQDHLTSAVCCSTATLCATRHRSPSIFAAIVPWTDVAWSAPSPWYCGR
jgi:hypothetical protein